MFACVTKAIWGEQLDENTDGVQKWRKYDARYHNMENCRGSLMQSTK